MSLKEDVIEMCQRAVRDNIEVMVRLPKTPLSWSHEKKTERLLQLYYLCQLNGCAIVKANRTDYKIHKLNKDSVILKPSRKSKRQ